LHLITVENALVSAFCAGLEVSDGDIGAAHVARAHLGRKATVGDDALLEDDRAADVVDDGYLLVVLTIVDDLDVDLATVGVGGGAERNEEKQNGY
jgi:hypothetical protein